MKYVDYMNIMIYDQVGGCLLVIGYYMFLGLIEEFDLEGLFIFDMVVKWWEERLEVEYDWVLCLVKCIVNYVKGLGVDFKQFVIGGVFYGRVWKGVLVVNNGFY